MRRSTDRSINIAYTNHQSGSLIFFNTFSRPVPSAAAATASPAAPILIVPPAVKIEITPIAKRDSSPAAVAKLKIPEVDKLEEDKKFIIKDSNDDDNDDDDAPIIPWRAQLRKTNSKLNIID